MAKKTKDIVNAFLANTAKENIQKVSEALVAEDAIYISLNFENEELQQIEPWAGTRPEKEDRFI